MEIKMSTGINLLSILPASLRTCSFSQPCRKPSHKNSCGFISGILQIKCMWSSWDRLQFLLPFPCLSLYGVIRWLAPMNSWNGHYVSWAGQMPSEQMGMNVGTDRFCASILINSSRNRKNAARSRNSCCRNETSLSSYLEWEGKKMPFRLPPSLMYLNMLKN